MAWVTTFLNARGLNHPDGRWLYAYQTTGREFGALEERLRVMVDGRPPHSLQRTLRFDALFVLFAAEWWRRRFGGGAWIWAPLLDAIGISHAAWLAADRQKTVVRGLAYWGHAPGNSGLAYLGAVAAQGGLPTRVIESAQGPLAQLLARTLRRAAQLNLEGEDIARSIRGDSRGLPAALRQDEIIELIAQMIGSVLWLRNRYRLAGQSDPVAVLDLQHPQWRREFPLQLEDAAARSLLEMLVGEAARAQVRTAGRPAVVQRFLQEEEEWWQLRSIVQVDPRIPASVLERWAGNPAPLPSILLLDVTAGHRQRVAVSSLRPGQEAERLYRSEALSPFWKGAEAAGEHTLTLSAEHRDLARVSIPRGEPLDPALPWVFTREGESWTLAGCGNVRVASSEALVLLPLDVRLVPAGEESPRSLHLDAAQRRAVCVRNDTEVFTAEGRRFRIKLGEIGVEPSDLIWEGKRLWLDTRPELVFIGMPRLVSVDADGNRAFVPSYQIVGPTQAPPDPRSVGRLRLSRLKDGILEQSWNVGVLPANAQMDVMPEGPLNGRIAFRQWGIKGARVLTPGVAQESVPGAGELTLRVRADGTPPSDLTIEVWWDVPGRGLRLDCPFPARGVRLIDAEGNDLSLRSTLSRRFLAGKVLRLIEQDPAAQYSYAIRVQLSEQTGIKVVHRHPPVFVRAVAEYRLIDFKDEIEAMLSLTENIDAKVEIVVEQQRVLAARLLISRSDAHAALAVDPRFYLANEVGMPVGRGLEAALMAVDLSRPEAEQKWPKEISSAADGNPTWDAMEIQQTPGLWMIGSKLDNGAAIRPLLLPVRPITVPPEADGMVSPLVSAICVSNTEAREEQLDGVLKQLVGGYEQRDYSLLGTYAAQLSHLPLGAFDPWRRLTRCPPLMADLLLMPPASASEGVDALLHRIDGELPFLWEAISQRTWLESGTRVREWFRALVSDPGIADKVLFEVIKQRFSQAPGTLADLGLVLAWDLAQSPSTELHGRYAGIIREGLELAHTAEQRLWRHPSSPYQGLLRRRIEKTWPEDRGLLQLIQSALGYYLKHFPKLNAVLPKADVPRHRLAITCLPIQLALDAVLGQGNGMASTPQHVRAARIMRSFDPEWFETSFAHTSRMCIGLTRQN